MINSSEFVVFYGPITEEDLIERSLAVCATIGFEPDSTEYVDTKEKYTKVKVPYKDWEIVLKQNKHTSRKMNEPALSITIDEEYDPSDGSDEARDAEMQDVLFELTCRLSMELGFEYVAWFNMEDRMNEVLPSDRPYSDAVETPPRFGVYDPEILMGFGGVEELFDHSPWYVGELVDGRTIVVETPHPWAECGWIPPSSAAFLADATLNPESETAALQLNDPFADFEPGEYGVDIVIPQDDPHNHFRNQDAETVRVYVDENHDLRRVDDDSFVRNVVTDATGSEDDVVNKMATDLPSSTNPSEVPLSILINDHIPSEMVRLDDPGDDNVVSLLMGLDVELDKYDMLLAIASRASTEEGFSDEELETIEEALGTLNTIDDQAQVEAVIQEIIL